jgi:predicted methyltransferase
MPRRKPWIRYALITLICAGGAGCATFSTRSQTAEAIDRVLASADRPEDDRVRDAFRHPRETLLFFGLRPEMTVVEVSSDGGWSTRILGPLLQDRGQLISVASVPGPEPIAPPDSVDMALVLSALQEWVNRDIARDAAAALLRALKPGGVLGVVGARDNDAAQQDPRALNDRINQDRAIRLIEEAGFRLVATSEINASPQDAPDGERFTLKFVKPR